jgi:4-diphosphocytidyl-2-C-methyl-D-erythritol kinase
LYPQVARLKEQFLKLGADYPLMTGSGPTIFALVNTDSRLNRLYNGLRGFCKQVYAVRTIGGEFFHA